MLARQIDLHVCAPKSYPTLLPCARPAPVLPAQQSCHMSHIIPTVRVLLMPRQNPCMYGSHPSLSPADLELLSSAKPKQLRYLPHPQPVASNTLHPTSCLALHPGVHIQSAMSVSSTTTQETPLLPVRQLQATWLMHTDKTRQICTFAVLMPQMRPRTPSSMCTNTSG